MLHAFHKLLEKPDKTKEEAMLVQAICALSVTPDHSSKTPEEIYEFLSETCQRVGTTQPEPNGN